MDAIHIKNYVLAALAAVGAFVSNALGGWDAMMKLLVALMALDIVTGWLIAAIWKESPKSATGKLESNANFKGLVKKGLALLLVWIGVLLDDALGAAYVRNAMVLFFVGNEGLSLLENLGIMGVPFPDFVKKALQALHDEGDQGAGGGGHE